MIGVDRQDKLPLKESVVWWCANQQPLGNHGSSLRAQVSLWNFWNGFERNFIRFFVWFCLNKARQHREFEFD